MIDENKLYETRYYILLERKFVKPSMAYTNVVVMVHTPLCGNLQQNPFYHSSYSLSLK